MSIYSNTIKEQMEDLFTELSSQPNRLLLRCIFHSSGSLDSNFLDPKEATFLKANGIAKVDENFDRDGDRVGKDFVISYSPPWIKIFQELYMELQAFRPGRPAELIVQQSQKFKR